ncbi:MAG: SDR family oxidoreductase [Actinomycetota bacterium]
MTQPPPYPTSHSLLEDKRVLITASAGVGIGFATARRCAEEGASVVLSDVHERRLREAVDELERLTGAKPLAVPCDVTAEDEVQNLFDTAIDKLGGLDVVVCNAGLGGTRNLVEMPDDEWNAVLNVTLNGTMRCNRAALRHMIERREGVIVNNASILGWRAQEGQAHYAAAKAGVMALTRTAAIEAAPYGVRVNAVAPSLAVHAFLTKVMSQDVLDDLVEKELFKRSAETWEVANVIVFLASDYSSYMTGEIVSVSSQHP